MQKLMMLFGFQIQLYLQLIHPHAIQQEAQNIQFYLIIQPIDQKNPELYLDRVGSVVVVWNMISQLRGKITEIGKNYIILDVNGVGYRVHMADKALNSLAKNTGQVNLCTRQLFDQHGKTFELFGFLKRGDLDFHL